MIGQVNLQKRINSMIENNTFPRFCILAGPKGSGKKTLAKEIINKLTDGLYEESGIKVEDIRQIITDAYKIHSTAVYFIPDADTMSNAAKNALLKVTEEPPNNAFFLMTLEDSVNTLETIRSRATVFTMEPYKPDELRQYYDAEGFLRGERSEEMDKVAQLCCTPGEVDLLVKAGVNTLYEYVKKVLDNIGEVSLSNAFKIADKIALKGEEDKYDLKLFWKIFEELCFENINDHSWIALSDITSSYIRAINTKGINRQMLFDNWIIDIREEIKGEAG